VGVRLSLKKVDEMGITAGIAGLTVIWFYHIKTIQPQRGGILIVGYACRGMKTPVFYAGVMI
jgi:hypothetical protein